MHTDPESLPMLPPSPEMPPEESKDTQAVAAEPATIEEHTKGEHTTANPKPTRPEGRKLQWKDLPVDMKSEVVKHVNRPTHMKTLCLVSKEFHEITVRFLYRNVSLDVGSSSDAKLSAFMNPKNIGLKHLRTLDLYLAEIRDKCMNQVSHAHFTIRMLLEFLPEDTLEKVSWHPWNPFNAENMLLLYRKQKRLKYVEAITLDRSITSEIESGKFDESFKGVRKVALFPDNRETLEYCHALLKRAPKVEKLTIQTNFGTEIPSRELNDSSTGAGLITRSIFNHLQPFNECTPLALKSLRLHKVHLRYASDTYCKFISFRTISSLHILHCPGADALLAEISKSQQLPEKLETFDFKHDDNAENDGLSALEGFLTLVSGVKYLTLDLEHTDTMPVSSCVLRHAKTLRAMNVHATTGGLGDDELVWDVQVFENIMKDCKELEAVSVAFPNTSLIRPTTDEFNAYKNALSQLPYLSTLHCTTWPNNKPSSSLLPRVAYESLLTTLASEIYTSFARDPFAASTSTTDTNAGANGAANNSPPPPPPPLTSSSSSSIPTLSDFHPKYSQLSILAFGTSDRGYEREDSLNQICYARGKRIDAEGKETVQPVKVSSLLRGYVDPRSTWAKHADHRPENTEAIMEIKGADANDTKFVTSLTLDKRSEVTS
ncbi:MAG: hypothetical protein M1820_006248 [Bogoriella megaspora]|nr:MAG: hypothetical protein M1820_006248 [Bogoriella megaspora]